MKKFLVKILLILFSISFVLFITTLFLRNIVVNNISNEYLKNKITIMVIENISDNFDEIDKNTIQSITEKLKNNPDFKKICNKIFDSLMNDLNNNTITNININEDIIKMIDNNIPSGYKSYVIKKINSIDFNKLYKNLLDYLDNEIIKQNNKYMKIIEVLLSTKFIVLMLILIILENIGIILLTTEKINLLFSYGICTMVIGGILVLLSFFFRQVLSYLAQVFVGGCILVSSSPLLIIGLLLVMIGMILKDIYEKKIEQ